MKMILASNPKEADLAKTLGEDKDFFKNLIGKDIQGDLIKLNENDIMLMKAQMQKSFIDQDKPADFLHGSLKQGKVGANGPEYKIPQPADQLSLFGNKGKNFLPAAGAKAFGKVTGTSALIKPYAWDTRADHQREKVAFDTAKRTIARELSQPKPNPDVLNKNLQTMSRLMDESQLEKLHEYYHDKVQHVEYGAEKNQFLEMIQRDPKAIDLNAQKKPVENESLGEDGARGAMHKKSEPQTLKELLAEDKNELNKFRKIFEKHRQEARSTAEKYAPNRVADGTGRWRAIRTENPDLGRRFDEHQQRLRDGDNGEQNNDTNDNSGGFRPR